MLLNILKKALILVTLGLVTMSIANSKLLAVTMCLEVDGEVEFYEVTGNYKYNGDGTVTLYPPWRIENEDGCQGSNTKKKTFKDCFLATQEISNLGYELQLNNSEVYKVSILDLNGKTIYSVPDKTNITINGSIMPPVSNGFYILHLENKAGKSEMINFIYNNGTFIISDPMKK